MRFIQVFYKVLKIFFVVSLVFNTYTCSATAIIEDSQKILHFEYDLVSADIKNLTLETIAKEFRQHTHTQIKFFIPASKSAVRISARFKGLSVNEAIRRVLSNENYIMYMPQSTQKGKQHKPNHRIYIYVLTSMEGMGAGQSKKNKELTELSFLIDNEQNLLHQKTAKVDSNPLIEDIDHSVVLGETIDSRIAGLHELVNEHTNDALPIVIGALMDENPAVRMNALQLVIDNSIGDIPFDTLSRLSLSDENHDVRVLAQELLIERYEEQELAVGRPPPLD